jgi:hydroxymethylpyrimidine pyrophosphatase-like HAD family hydrolase
MTNKEYKQKRPFIIAVDCDGTIWKRDVKFPGCGTPRQEIIDQIKKFKKAGAVIILWTCRGSKTLEPVIAFCKEQGIVYDAINKNYKSFTNGFAKRKIFAHYYIDDQMFSPEQFAKLDVEAAIKQHNNG